MISYILHPNLNLSAHAGRKLWAMGYDQNETTILNPFECFLEIAKDDKNGQTFLRLVNPDDMGELVEVVSNDRKGALVFLAETEREIFDIDLVHQIRMMLAQRVSEAIEHRVSEGMRPEDIFFTSQSAAVDT